MSGRAAVLAALLSLSGCVERELRVESDPPGAEVYLDGRLAGKTPHVEKFVFYGSRELELRHDGFGPARQIVSIRPPWYQWLPLDFFFELLYPGTLVDVHEVKVSLQPMEPADEKELLERAKKGREEGLKTLSEERK